MSFNELGLNHKLLRAVEALGYDTPTEVQHQAIPQVLDGRDVIGCAQTGTGKTAAFVLPILQRLGEPLVQVGGPRDGQAPSEDGARRRRRRRRGERRPDGVEQNRQSAGAGGQRPSGNGQASENGNGNGKHASEGDDQQRNGNGGGPAGHTGPDAGRKAPQIRALVVTPTRELCAQIEEVARICGKQTGHGVLAVYGGVPYGPQAQRARRGVDLLVATPGRLLDLQQQGDVDLSGVSILVLDEADRMLDMGFWPDVRRIVNKLPRQRQNLLFSATMSRAVLDVIGDTLVRPVHIQVGGRAQPVENVDQRVFPVHVDQKTDLLVEFLKQSEIERALVFTRTKHRAERLSKILDKKGIRGTAIHGNRTQVQRQQALDGFKSGRYKVLVATDVVARGIDVEGISHVVNYDIPTNPEDYVHRIGRTARAGASGSAVSFLTAEDVHELKDIERLIGATLERHDLDGFEYLTRRIPESHEVAKRPGKLVWNGGARRAAQRGIRRTTRVR